MAKEELFAAAGRKVPEAIHRTSYAADTEDGEFSGGKLLLDQALLAARWKIQT